MDKIARYIFPSVALLLAMMPLVAHAQKQVAVDTTKIYAIDEVDVVTRRVVTEIVPAQRMSGAMLQRLNTHSVADAVRYFSGVQIKDYGGIGGLKTLNIRSMGTNQMGVFYNGIQLGNAQNGQVDLGRFSLDNMQSIELYNGQKSSMLQAAKDYGSAGTIYLQTRRPHFDSGEKFHFTATMKTGSFGLVNPSLLWQQKITNSVSSSVSAEYTYAHGRYKFRHRRVNPDGTLAYDTVAVRENADIQALRTEASLHGALNEGEWNVHFYNYYSERGLPGYVARNIYSHKQRQWDDNFFAQGSLRKNVGERYALLANVKYAYDFTHYFNPDTTLQLIDNHYKQQEVYLSLANTVKIFRWWELALSTDLQWNALDADLNDFSYPTRYTGLVALSTAFKWPHFKLQASGLGTFVHEKVKRHTPAPDKQVFTPAVIASVRPVQKVPFDIRAFYKRIFRMPTFNDLYYTFIGNAQLTPEYVSQYDVGLSYAHRRAESVLRELDLQLDGYYNDVNDKIVAVPTANPFRWQMMNLGKVKILGVDVSALATIAFCKHWEISLRANYTYQDARDMTDESENYFGDQIPYTPWHSGTTVLNLSYKGWNLNYSFIYTGERYNQSANIPENYVQPWYTSDLSLTKQFDVKKTKLTATAEVNNLFNQQYDVVLNYPMPGTNFKIILKFEI